ncbi:hypothetical protein [Paraflavitalea speifideaquila]|uniref:hypothetical protein n=1 Tax=Paraflavitalea speifideaquila TaxID=3076558 RepID=UPI0028EF1F6B|nr:hypothetical protein [Paraflavitalea speifideiaquila]
MEKAKELEAEMGTGEEDGGSITTAYDQVAFRAYAITKEIFSAGMTVRSMEDYMYKRKSLSTYNGSKERGS